MMMPASSFSSSSGSSASATVRVEKATSEFLNGPDWTMNIDICDTINSNHWLAKDVVKAVKKRLQHKSCKVHLLALTLLETMVKNCGDHVHFQIAERNVLPEMIKIVKKKTDMHVREKILVLLDSWQEAFGGRGGKYPQYYFAYEELRHSGVEFPWRTSDAAPIFTPPVTHPNPRQVQAGYGMPINSSTRLDEAMASEIENLSLSSIESMRNVLDLLSDMLQAVDTNDRAAVKDEVIVDVVHRCRSNQKKLMQMLTMTSDEELLGQGLELNDSLQSVLAKHDAIASGLPMPTQIRSSIAKPTEVRDVNSASGAIPSAGPVLSSSRNEAVDEEDDFAQLARRHSKMQSSGTGEGVSTVNTSNNPTASDPSLSMALALTDPPPPVWTTKEQDMIDFSSISLSTSTTSPPHTPQTPPIASSQNVDQTPTQRYPHVSQPYPVNQGQVHLQSYVVPWAQAQPQPQTQPWPQAQPQFQPQPQVQSQPWAQAQPQSQPQPQPQAQAQSWVQAQSQSQRLPWTRAQPQSQPQQAHFSSAYPPPPWAATPGYYNNPYSSSTPYTSYSTPQATSYMPWQGTRPSQQVNSNPTSTTPAGQKPFIPSYRLFEDLNVLGNDGRSMTSNTTTSLTGTSGQSMVGGKK